MEDAVAPPPAGAAASSSDCPGAADAAPPPAAEAQAEEQVGSVPLWAGPSDAWADFASDRAQLQELVAWIRDNDGVDPGARCSPFSSAWARARARCSRATVPRPRDSLLPEGVRPLIPLISATGDTKTGERRRQGPCEMDCPILLEVAEAWQLRGCYDAAHVRERG